MKNLLKQDQRVMFDYQDKKRFGIIVGFLKNHDRVLYIVKTDKKIKDYNYECVGVYENAIIPMEDKSVIVEGYDLHPKRGGCIS